MFALLRVDLCEFIRRFKYVGNRYSEFLLQDKNIIELASIHASCFLRSFVYEGEP